MRINIYAVADYRHEFPVWQNRCLGRFLSEAGYRYVCVNNGRDRQTKALIRAACSLNSIEWIDVPDNAQDQRTANYAHASALKWLWDNLSTFGHADYHVVLDFDMFLCAPFSFEEYMAGFKVAGIQQSRGAVNYLWPGFVIVDTSAPDWRDMQWQCTTIRGENVDVGGGLYHWLKAHPEVPVRQSRHSAQLREHDPSILALPERYRPDYRNPFNFVIVEDAWLHFSNGAGWNPEPQETTAAKLALAERIIDDCCKGVCDWRGETAPQESGERGAAWERGKS